MADFNKAIEVILKHEGGYSDNLYDNGGKTNIGITLDYLKSLHIMGDINTDGVINEQDIKMMDKKTAINIYKTHIWDKHKYYKIRDDHVATKVFDLRIHLGERQAHLITQEAVNLTHNKDVLIQDGILGPLSFKALNKANPWAVVNLLRGLSAYYYLNIYKNNETQRVFIEGWLNRAMY